MEDHRLPNSEPVSVRNKLRFAGPTVGLVGLGFLLVGGVDFLFALAQGDIPRFLWCLWLGLPLVLAGAVATQFAFVEKAARPVAPESASPVDGAKDGGGTVVGAVGEDLRPGDSAAGLPVAHPCYNCKAVVPAGARYCAQCGQAVLKARFCPNCGEFNDPRAKSCEHCYHMFQ